MNCRQILFSGVLSLAVGFVPAGSPTASAAVVEQTVGQWDWGVTDPNNPLANTVNPGTYDATAHNSAPYGSGIITIDNVGTPHNTKDHYFDVGTITELSGARYFRWQFNNVTFSNWDGNGDTKFILAGANEGNNVFNARVTLRRNDDGTPKTAFWYLELYGKDKNGAPTAEVTTVYSSTIKMVPNTAYDLQYIYEVTGNGQDATALATFKVSEHGQESWTTSSKAANTVELNALGGPVYLGKPYADSGSINDETIGKTTLFVAVPEPASLGLIGMGALVLLAMRRR